MLRTQWAAAGGLIGGLAPLLGIYTYQGNPHPERLVGKSPEYVESYTDTYIAKSRSLRTKWAAAGGLIGVGVGGGVGCLSTSYGILICNL